MVSVKKSLQSLGVTTAFLLPILGIVSNLTPPVLAQSIGSSMEISLQFPKTGNVGAPRTMGGGTRGRSCVTNESGELSLTALMPTRSNIGKTVTDSPMFSMYIPETTAESGEFVLIDEEGNEVFLETVDLPTTPGLVSLKASLPQSETGFPKVGQKYYWYFSIICNPLDRSQDIFVEGSLERTELSASIKEELAGKSALEQAAVYAQYQIWHEVLEKMAELRERYPNEWAELLESVGLEAIASHSTNLSTDPTSDPNTDAIINPNTDPIPNPSSDSNTDPMINLILDLNTDSIGDQ